ncbi:NrfD/PsrC family molybdoenzyme membrane anchor subunit [Marinifilum flexuosum]|uniref:Formate-dependent nitrite reductase membrane component NrfD n=1 Tax=Marinifilum flexuosum TaxID=1117708 RepID=A0A419WGQ6_9BACT|nr:NrfD/PsrC family molybdoenzyme membrane anchor subunit [Marinifilum flexuosum]RKD94597.1 formate-dependent nitrite reductase membrane component NrfD [Marinifilum flexuosum]
MNEEIIISGRMNPKIDPVLAIWGWEIPLYLFLGGLAAGILFFAALYTILGREKELPTAVRKATFLVPAILVIGLFALFLDLKNKLYFWQLYTTIRLESPMSWGAWVLMLVTPLSIVWCVAYWRDLVPNWKFKVEWLEFIEEQVNKYRKPLAWVMIVSSVILGIYTGILLSAFNARPLWNTSILGPLFLVSGLSTGAAVIMCMSKDHLERTLFSKIDLILIGIEIFFIIHLFMGFLASNAAQIEAAQLFLGGAYTLPFWGGVVVLGLLVPAILEIMELRGKKIPVAFPAFLILLGGMIFRFIMVDAGQLSKYLY